MGTIYVFNKLKWKPPVTAKYLKPPELELNLSYPDDEIAPMPGKQRAIFDAKFKGSFDSKYNALSQTRIKAVQDAIKWTEERLPEKSEKEAAEVVATSNKLLKQAFETWQGEIQKLCDQCVMQAYEDSVKEMKMKLVKAQIKSVARIVIIAGLILTAAGLAIAASVVSGGALAPLVLGVLATGGAALWKAYKVYDTEWASSSNKIKEIQADIKKLQGAVEAYKKAEKSYAGTLDKVKAFKETILAPVSDIDKHVGQLDKYIFELQTAIKDQKAKLAALQSQAKTGEIDSAVRTCNANLDKADDQLSAITDVKAEAAKIKADYAAQKVPDYGKLNVVVVKLSGSASAVQSVGTSLQGCMTALKSLGVAVG